MSDANLQVAIESGQAVSGSRTVVRSINDIYNAANAADTKLRSMESTLGSVGSNSGLTQAKAAMQSLQSPLQSVKDELEKIESRIVRIGVTAIALGVVSTVFGKIKETLSGAIKAVDDFQISVISIAASLTQIRVANGETDLAKAYQISSQYAGELALKLQEVDKNSFANYKGLMAMLQVMTAQGQVLDINNKKQVDAFTNLSNAIAIMTPGQDQQMQMYQETRAIMSGVVDRHSQVARMLDQQIKAQGIYKGGLKEVAALGRQHGDTIERIAPYLQGIGAASGDIAQTWSTVVATFETALNFIQRMAFGPIVKDLTQMVSLFSDLMKSNVGGISDAMQGAWKYIKEAVFVIDEKTKKLKFSEDFLTTLKIVADITKAIIDSFAILIKWTIKYSDEMKTLLEVYLAYKVISLASLQVNKLMAASQESLVNAMIARQTALARLGITESSALTIQQQSVLASRESLLVAAQEATASATKQAARQAEVASINAAAQAKIKETAQSVENIQVRRWEIGLEQEAQAAKISGLRLNAELLVQERLLAESRVASASAYANASIAANGKAWSTEAIAIEKAERDLLSAAIGRETTARMALESTMIRLSGLEAEEISLKSGQVTAEQAVLSAKIRAIEVDSAATTAAVRHNAALLALGETTGFVNAASLAKVQTDYLRLVEQDRLTGSVLAATAVETAHTEAIAMNTAAKNANSIANQVLTASTNLLQGALALIGGPIGALIIAIGALTYAWVKLTEAEEVNRAKKNQKIFDSDLSVAQRELDEVNKKLAEAKKLKDKKTDPVKFEADEEQDRLNKMMITETRLRKELADAEKSLRSIRVGGVSVARDEAEERVRSAQIQVDYFRKVSDATAKGKKEIEEYNTETMKGYKGTGIPEDKKGKKSESEKASDKLKEGSKAFQLESVKMGRVEDELGSKIEARHLQMTNLFEETKLANGSEDKAMREKTKQFVQLADLQQTEAANKKATAAVEKAYQEQSLSDYKNNMAAKKVELHDNLEDGKISYTEYYQSIRNMVEELGNKEIAVLQDSYNIKKSEMDKRAELYWNDQLSYSEYLKSVKELIEAETKLKNLKAGVAATVASANKDITKGQKEEAKLTADIEDKVLNLTKQWVAAAKAKNAYYKTTPEYKKLSAESKKRADAMGELDEFSAGQQERQAGYTVAENKMSAIGGDNYGSKYFKIATQYEEETALIKEQYKLRLIDQETYTAQMEQSQSKHQSQMTGMVFDAATEMTGVLRQAAGDSVELQMAAMLIEKSIAIARILVNTEVAASAALAIPIVGIGQAQVIRALGYASAAMVATTAVVEGINIAGQREFGGPVSAGKAYIVGEKRPEVFVPDQNGTILPSVPTNGQADNSTFVVNQTVQIDARGADAGVEARIDAAMKRAKAETEASIMNSMNRGGKFAVASGRR